MYYYKKTNRRSFHLLLSLKMYRCSCSFFWSASYTSKCIQLPRNTKNLEGLSTGIRTNSWYIFFLYRYASEGVICLFKSLFFPLYLSIWTDNNDSGGKKKKTEKCRWINCLIKHVSCLSICPSISPPRKWNIDRKKRINFFNTLHFWNPRLDLNHFICIPWEVSIYSIWLIY